MDVLNYALGFDNPFDKFNAGVERGLGLKATNEAQLKAIEDNKRAQEAHRSGLATAALGRQLTQQQIATGAEQAEFEREKNALELARLRDRVRARRNVAAGRHFDDDGPDGDVPGDGGVSAEPGEGVSTPSSATMPTPRASASTMSLPDWVNSVEFRSLPLGVQNAIGLALYDKDDLSAAVDAQSKAQAQQVGKLMHPLLYAVLSGDYGSVESMRNGSDPTRDPTLVAYANMFSDGSTPENREMDRNKAVGMVDELQQLGGFSKEVSGVLFDRIKANEKAVEPLTTKERLDLTSALRKEYSAVANAYNKLLDEYNKLILALNDPNKGIGDITGIFTYMKTLDPTSVVREGEFNIAAASQGIWSQIETYFKKLESGERLDDAARNAMANLGYQFTLLGYNNANAITAPILEQAKEYEIDTRQFTISFAAPKQPVEIKTPEAGDQKGNEQGSKTQSGNPKPSEFVMLPVPDENENLVTTRIPLLTSLTDPRKKALKRGDYFAILEPSADNQGGPLKPTLYVKE